jgi:hypothetical protein
LCASKPAPVDRLCQLLAAEILEVAIEGEVFARRESLPQDVVLRAHTHNRVDLLDLCKDVDASAVSICTFVLLKQVNFVPGVTQVKLVPV